MAKPKQIRFVSIPGTSEVDSLSEINERLEEFGITPENIISVQTGPCVYPIPIHTPTGSVMPKVAVSVFYWG